MACIRDTNNEPLYVYVNALGSDTNQGLRPTQAVKTINKALEIVERYDLTNFGASIFLADGTYTEDIILRETSGGQGVNLTSSGNTTLNCQISGTDLTSTFIFTGLTLRQTNPTKPLVTLSNANASLVNCKLELIPDTNSAIYPLIALNGAILSLSGTLDIIYNGTYSCPGWCYVGATSSILGEGLTVVTTGSNIWSSGGVYVAAGGTANLQAMILTDTTRGALWIVEAGGTLYSIPLITSLPGDTLGTGAGTIAPQGVIIGGGTSTNSFIFEAVRPTSAPTLSFPQNRISNPEGLEKSSLWTYTAITVDAAASELKYDARGVGYPWFDLIKETADTSVHSIKQLVAVSGQAMVLQVNAKIDPSLVRTKCFIRLSSLTGTSTVLAIYDIGTGVVSGITTTGSGVHTSSSVISSSAILGRCVLSCSIPDDGDSVIAEYGIALNATTTSYLGDPANGLFLQGASLTLGTDIAGYEYANTGAAEVVFATPNPSALQVAANGGTLQVPAGILSGNIGGLQNLTSSFAVTEVSNRICIVTSTISSVTSGGNNNDLTISTPLNANSTVDPGGSALVTITPTAAGIAASKTLSGFVSFNYLDINSAVQTVTKSFSLTTLIVPTLSNVRVYVAYGTNPTLSNAQSSTQNFTGTINMYVYCLGCASNNVINLASVSSTTGGVWSAATALSSAIKLGSTTTDPALSIHLTAIAGSPGGTLVVNLTFVEIAGTFSFSLIDNV